MKLEELEAMLSQSKQPDLRDEPLDLIPSLREDEGTSFGSSI
jgi:hypothetical protein